MQTFFKKSCLLANMKAYSEFVTYNMYYGKEKYRKSVEILKL